MRGNGLEHIGSTAHCTLAAPIVIINIIISVMFPLDVESIYQELRRLSEVTFLSLSASTETVPAIYFLQAVDSLKSSTLWIPQPPK